MSNVPSVVQLEICVESVESARAAEQGGAARVELCSALSEGGLTPSAGLIAMVRRSIKIPLHVLIRPRAGDFCYSEDELEVMQRDILLTRQLGANGVALGVLDPKKNIDVARTRTLVAAAAPMQTTFHRAFDFANDLHKALQAVIETGSSRILTSGGAATAAQGKAVLQDLVQQAGSAIGIMAAGKIRPDNIADLIRATGIREVHANLATQVLSAPDGKVEAASPEESSVFDRPRNVVSPDTVAALLRAANGAG